MAEQLLYSTKQACEVMGGISSDQLVRIAGEFAIRIGTGNFYKPEDLKDVRDELDYGKQA
ncbi:hypothetical protein BPY_20960 [Bifidobacterium psychraerophilum]|uniref:hypothetical protein n=1 Tax=Bifidobacterium psychraerophilum TaxID=218140 RepID=UPI00311340B3